MTLWAKPRRAAGHPDLQLVARAAALVELSEYDLFALAYRRWYGREAPPRLLEAAFSAYLRGQAAPAWVRHAARGVLEGNPAVLADAQARCRDSAAAEGAPRHGWLAVVGTLAAVALALWMVARPPSHLAETGTAVPLSCQGGGPGLVVIERLAHAVAERRAPEC